MKKNKETLEQLLKTETIKTIVEALLKCDKAYSIINEYELVRYAIPDIQQYLKETHGLSCDDYTKYEKMIHSLAIDYGNCKDIGSCEEGRDIIENVAENNEEYQSGISENNLS